VQKQHLQLQQQAVQQQQKPGGISGCPAVAYTYKVRPAMRARTAICVAASADQRAQLTFFLFVFVWFLSQIDCGEDECKASFVNLSPDKPLDCT
jgi:hypothetical protein